MATPPTRVSFNTPSSGNFSANGNTKVSTAFDVTVGDVIVVLESSENANTTTATPTAPTASGGSVTWTLQAVQPGTSDPNRSFAACWTGAVGATATGITVTATRPNPGDTTPWWGFSASVYRNHGGVGTSFSGNNGTSSTAPSQAGTASCAANSAVLVQINDWNAADGTTRTWRTVNGSAETETVYFRDAAHHTVYGGYAPDTGAAGSITQGLTAPTGQRWVLAGVEILGTAGGAAARTPAKVYNGAAIRRSSTY